MRSTYRRSAMIAAIALLLFGLAPQAAFSEGTAVSVYFKGQRLEFPDAQPVIKDGRTLVPFRKLFETLGFTVQWIDSNGLRQAVGKKDGLEIRLTIDDANAKVNGKTVVLDVPAQIIDNSTMVPLRFVSENSGYQVGFSGSAGGAEVRISAAGEAEPYVVKGRVTDPTGRPVEGAEVFADNQLIYNSNLTAVTDESGYYRIELPLLAATWRMGGSYKVESHTVELTPEIDQAFAGNTGAVRNFTMRTETLIGELYLYMALDSFAEGFVESHVELTLTPIGPLAGGGSGKVITGYGYSFPGGFGMNEVPVGKYKATAAYAPPGEKPVPMNIRVRNKGTYADSVEFEFGSITPGVRQAELEVAMP